MPRPLDHGPQYRPSQPKTTYKQWRGGNGEGDDGSLRNGSKLGTLIIYAWLIVAVFTPIVVIVAIAINSRHG